MRLCLVPLVLLVLFGCGPQHRSPPAEPTPPSPLARAERITELYDAGKLDAAMLLVREEIAAPAFDHEKWAAAMRLMALELTVARVELRGADPELVAEARQFHDEHVTLSEANRRYLEGLGFVPDGGALYGRTSAAQRDLIWGMFLNRIGAHEEALEALARARAGWEAGAEVHPADEVRILGEVAAAHAGLGASERAAALDEEALRRAEAFLAAPPEYSYSQLHMWRSLRHQRWAPTFFGHMLARCEGCTDARRRSIRQAMVASLGGAPDLVRVTAGARMADALLAMGDVSEARASLGEVDHAALAASDESRAGYVAGVAAAIAVADSRPDEALALLAAWDERSDYAPIAIRTTLARAHELKGDDEAARAHYERAVQLWEESRDKRSVAARQRFFTPARMAAYWGLLRLDTRRAAASGSEADFLAALAASERVRARQLGDILVQRGFVIAPAFDMAALRQSIGEREAWIDVVPTDGGTAVLALTREQFRAVVLPTTTREVSASTSAVRAALLAGKDAPPAQLQALAAVVVEPVAEIVADKSEWVLLCDGALAALPFDLLPYQGGRLLARVETRLAPSVALLRAAPLHNRAPAGLFALGDPLFPTDAVDAASGARLLPLPETRSEIARIAAQVAPTEVTTLLAERATESAVRTQDLARYRLLHFATHGLLGGQLATLHEPALALSAEPGQDGFLAASEVERLDLAADVVVLSACDTGRGEQIAGEGVVGLGRAFLVAGARSVVVSLWPVDSIATEELMVAFYRHLGDNPPGAALRLAKLDMQQGRHSGEAKRRALVFERTEDARPAALTDPYFWAGFTVVSKD